MNDKDQSKRVDEKNRSEETAKRDLPEPPERYHAESHETRSDHPGGLEPTAATYLDPEFESIRKLANASKIMAIVSLLIGGVLLSSAAVITSIMAYTRATRAYGVGKATGKENDLDGREAFLKRSARASVIVSVAALVLNAAALAYIAPLITETMLSGDYSTLFGSAPSSTPSAGSSSFWG